MAFAARSVVLLVALDCCLSPRPSATASEPPRVTVEFRRAESKPGDGLTEAKVVGSADKVYLHKAVEITNADIDEARPGFRDDEYEVLLRFTKSGAEKMAKLCEAHQGKPLAMLVDGKVVCAPVLRGTITTHAAIRGSFTQAEVDRIAKGVAGK